MAKTAKMTLKPNPSGPLHGLRNRGLPPQAPPATTLDPLIARQMPKPPCATCEAAANAKVGAQVVAGSVASPDLAGKQAEPDEGIDKSRRERSTAQAPSTVSPIAWSK